MGLRPLATACWIKFLLLHGFSEKRIKGSHYQYTKRGKRTIPVWGNEKQIPGFHLAKGCQTIGCSVADLYAWAANNC